METITRKKIEQTCLETIAKEMGLNSSELNTDMNLRDDLDIVSLDAMNIIMSLEDEFEIEADIETVLEMQKVSDIIDTVLEMQKVSDIIDYVYDRTK